MFGSIGVPELVIAVVVLITWLVPLVAAVWVVVTLHRLKRGQEDLRAKLDTIERQVTGGR